MRVLVRRAVRRPVQPEAVLKLLAVLACIIQLVDEPLCRNVCVDVRLQQDAERLRLNLLLSSRFLNAQRLEI